MGLRGGWKIEDGDGKVERVPLCSHRGIIKLSLFLGLYTMRRDNPCLSSLFFHFHEFHLPIPLSSLLSSSKSASFFF